MSYGEDFMDEDEAIEDYWYKYEQQKKAYEDAESEYWEKKMEEEYRRKNTFVPLDGWKNDPYKRSHSYEYNRDWWNKNVQDDG